MISRSSQCGLRDHPVALACAMIGCILIILAGAVITGKLMSKWASAYIHHQVTEP